MCTSCAIEANLSDMHVLGQCFALLIFNAYQFEHGIQMNIGIIMTFCPQPFITVHAIDQDLNENGRLTYAIDESLTTEQVLNNFRIDAETGEVSLTHKLDAGKVTNYEIPIIASDRSHRSLTGEQTDMMTNVFTKILLMR